MSLTPKRTVTEKILAANRANAQKSHGAATPAGKARAARANLRHGSYAQDSPEVMRALGENSDDYRRLESTLENNLSGGLEGELVKRIARSLWRMRRTERIQDSLTLKRVERDVKFEQHLLAIKLQSVHESRQRLEALAAKLVEWSYVPTPENMEDSNLRQLWRLTNILVRVRGGKLGQKRC
jgi:hypothetical protein